MNHIPKIHFINRIDCENAGDWYCSPLMYYYDFFCQFNIIRHDVDFIAYEIVEKDDIVIIGGSGMLYVTETFQSAINHLLDLCDTVIAWSVGFNTHDRQWFQGDTFSDIDFKRFALIAIRDYEHPSGLEYLPCPSVLAFERPNQEVPIKRKYGVIEHKDLPISNLYFSDRIKNSCSLAEIQEYIRSSEAIITNSYHCAYWTQLLGKKSIVVNKFSTKFDFFEHAPQFVETNGKSQDELKKEFERAFQVACVDLNFYDRAVALNQKFFEKVKLMVKEKKIPKNKAFQEWYQLTALQLWNRQAQAGKIRAEIYEFHEDIYGKMKTVNEEIAQLYEKNECLQRELEWAKKSILERAVRKIRYLIQTKYKDGYNDRII